MKNSVSEQSFYIESEEEEEEDEEKPFEGKVSDNEEENDSDSSGYSNEHDNDPRQHSKPNSLNPSWPQSYRQSIDLYSSVPSPSLNFLGQSPLSHLSGSFLSSSLTRRHTPEILPSLSTALIPTPDEKPKERRSSHSLLPPLPPSRKSSSHKIIPDGKPSMSHGAPVPRNSSFGQAVLNGMNVLCGVGILSTPYAVEQGGWLGLSILFIFALLSYYTGILLRYCLDSQPGLETYPDIGQAAFGTAGRVAISIVLYVELYACCVEYIILESDNLSSLFPDAHLNLGMLYLNSKHLFAVMTALAVLPTVWLKDLSVLSYISAGGVIASILVVACLFWAGLVDQVGFESKQTMLNLSTLPVAIGLYGYCYSGHAVFPNIYSSLEKPNQYPAVLLVSFGICTVLYAAVAVLGYTMFGDSAASQFTLNMPKDLVSSKIAVWTTVVNPFTKYPFFHVSLIYKLKWSFDLLTSLINVAYICVDHVSGGYVSRGISAIKAHEIPHLFDSHQNSFGSFYVGRRCNHTFLRSCDVIDRIFVHNACHLDSSLCVLLEHLKRKNQLITGLSVYTGHHGGHHIICCRNLLISLQNYPELELIHTESIQKISIKLPLTHHSLILLHDTENKFLVWGNFSPSCLCNARLFSHLSGTNNDIYKLLAQQKLLCCLIDSSQSFAEVINSFIAETNNFERD